MSAFVRAKKPGGLEHESRDLLRADLLRVGQRR